MSFPYLLPPNFELQSEGGDEVTCPVLPELITEGETVQESIEYANGALQAVIEAYHDLARPLPPVLRQAGA